MSSGGIRLALATLLLVHISRLAVAQPSSPVSALPIPGTSAALARAAGIDPTLPRWRVLREVVRRVYSTSEVKALELQRTAERQRLWLYLADVRKYEVLLLAAGSSDGTVSLAGAAEKGRRDPLRAFLEFVGLELKEREKVYRVEARSGSDVEERRARLSEAGADLAALEQALNAGEAYAAQLPVDTVPLPLEPATWANLLREPIPTRQLAAALLPDRNASLLYYGLTALDGSTREFLSSSPDLLRKLYEQASAFATATGGLRVEKRRVLVPGGPSAEPLWRELVGESPSNAEAFVRRLFDRDDGKLAFFYGTIAQLPAPAQKYALGLWNPDATWRIEAFERLYKACTALFVNWTPALLPFNRTAGDGADLLQRIDVGEDGTLAGPRQDRLWRAILGDGSSYSATSVDAATLVSLICVPDFIVRRDRTAMFLFAQRVFASPGAQESTEVPSVLRGFLRYPALALTLERIGVTDPRTYAEAMGLADRFSRIGSVETAARSMASFQAALAVLERIRYARTLDASTASRLAASLIRLPLSEDGEYSGHLARWFDAELLPTLSRVVATTADGPDAALLAAMAGRLSTPPLLRRVVWEDVTYRLDAGASEQARFERIRRKQAGNRLDAVLAFWRAAAWLATSVKTVEAITPAVKAVVDAGKGLKPPQAVGLTDPADTRDVSAIVERAAEEALKIKKAKDLDKLARLAVPLVRLADAALADTLTSLAYVAALGDPTGTASLAPDVGARHDFGLRQHTEDARARTPWMVPSQVFTPGQPWRVTGSLLALDRALATLALRRVAPDRMPEPPTLHENERQTLAEVVIFINRHDLRDQDLDAIVAAIEAGEALVARARTDASAFETVVARAPLPQWRAEALRWVLEHQAEEVEHFFGLSELLRIGSAEDPAAAFDAWGTSEAPWSGRLGLHFPHRQPWEVFEGRRGLAGLATRLPDLTLWVARALAKAKLPAEIAGDVLASATQDLIDEVQLVHPDDWLSAMRYVRALPDTRLDDYVAALTAMGPLVPDTHDERSSVR